MPEHRPRPLAQALLDGAPPLLPDVEVLLAPLTTGRSPEAVFLHRLVQSVLEQRGSTDGPASAGVRVRGADLKHLAVLLRRPVLDLLAGLTADGLVLVTPAESGRTTDLAATPAASPRDVRGLVPQQRCADSAPAATP